MLNVTLYLSYFRELLLILNCLNIVGIESADQVIRWNSRRESVTPIHLYVIRNALKFQLGRILTSV